MPALTSDTRRKRILFVDDQPLILEGLQRILRRQRKEWDMVFADCGEAALAALEASPFDVIVTDMRMPGMDGARLLECVRDRFPVVIRIVLSGFSERDTALRAVPVAHQYLAKPCDPSKLRDAIERCCGIGRYVRDEATQRLVGAIGELPSLPHSLVLLMKELETPEATVTEIGRIIEHDVGIAAKLLQLVNSAFFGPSHGITSVGLAVSYLGLDTLKALLLSAAVSGMFRPARHALGFSMEGFQEHSHLSARIAGRLPLPKNLATAAVMAALLHDTGMLVLSTRLPELFGKALSICAKEERALCRVEEELTGTTHAEIGAYLLGIWGLPPMIVDAVGCHHHPSAGAQTGKGLDVLASVHIADVLAQDHQTTARTDFPRTDDGLNLDYLTALGVADNIPSWQAMAAGIALTPG